MNRKMSLRIYFENNQSEVPLTYKLKMLVRDAVEATLDYEQYGNPCEVSVTFVNNEEIHALNKKFRGVDRPTDVLSFPLFDYEGESEEPAVDELMGMLGDVVLSMEQAKAQAAQGQPQPAPDGGMPQPDGMAPAQPPAPGTVAERRAAA